MRRKNLLLTGAISLLAATLLVSCNVDDSYDLGKIDDSNMGIGTDQSEFNLPLVTVSLDASKLTIDGSLSAGAARGYSTTTIASLLDDFVAIMPSILTGTYAEEGVNIDKLKSDKVYTAGLVSVLFAELENNATKRLSFCTFVYNNKGKYPDIVSELENVGVDTNSNSPQEWSDDLGREMSTAEDNELDTVMGYVTDGILDYTQQIETTYSIDEQEVNEKIEIDDDTLSLLTDNIDELKNTIRLLARITSNLPFDITVKPYIILEGGEKIAIADIDGANGLESTTITAEQLEECLGKFKFSLELTLGNYKPNDLGDYTLYLSIFLRKNGAITL